MNHVPEMVSAALCRSGSTACHSSGRALDSDIEKQNIVRVCLVGMSELEGSCVLRTVFPISDR